MPRLQNSFITAFNNDENTPSFSERWLSNFYLSILDQSTLEANLEANKDPKKDPKTNEVPSVKELAEMFNNERWGWKWVYKWLTVPATAIVEVLTNTLAEITLSANIGLDTWKRNKLKTLNEKSWAALGVKVAHGIVKAFAIGAHAITSSLSFTGHFFNRMTNSFSKNPATTTFTTLAGTTASIIVGGTVGLTALLSNPVGWAIILVGGPIALAALASKVYTDYQEIKNDRALIALGKKQVKSTTDATSDNHQKKLVKQVNEAAQDIESDLIDSLFQHMLGKIELNPQKSIDELFDAALVDNNIQSNDNRALKNAVLTEENMTILSTKIITTKALEPEKINSIAMQMMLVNDKNGFYAKYRQACADLNIPKDYATYLFSRNQENLIVKVNFINKINPESLIQMMVNDYNKNPATFNINTHKAQFLTPEGVSAIPEAQKDPQLQKMIWNRIVVEFDKAIDEKLKKSQDALNTYKRPIAPTASLNASAPSVPVTNSDDDSDSESIGSSHSETLTTAVDTSVAEIKAAEKAAKEAANAVASLIQAALAQSATQTEEKETQNTNRQLVTGWERTKIAEQLRPTEAYLRPTVKC